MRGVLGRDSAGELRGNANKCLDVIGGATANGTGIAIWDCNGGANQQFTLTTDGSIKASQSGRCLDVTGQNTANGAAVEIWDCNGQANQKWTRT